MTNNNTIKANMEDYKTYKTLVARMNSIDYFAGDEEKRQWEEAVKAVNDFISSRDWFTTIFHKNGMEGLLDLDGSVLVPSIFDKVAYVYSRIGVNVTTPIIVVNDGKYGLVQTDGKGNMVLPCEHDDITMDETLAFFRVVDGGKTMLVKPNGEPLTPQTLDKVYGANANIVVVQTGDKYGLLNLNSSLFVEPSYDNIEVEFDDIVIAHKDGVQGYLSDNDGHFIPQEEYEKGDVEEELVTCF